MKSSKEKFLTPMFLFLVLLLDGQLSRLFIGLLSGRCYPISHLLLIYMIFISINFSRTFNLVLFMGLGLIYDVYYLHIIGIFVILFPLLSAFIIYMNDALLLNRLTRFLSVITAVFLIEIVSVALALLLKLAVIDFSHFIIFSLVPTLLVNAAFFLVFQTLFEKVYL